MARIRTIKPEFPQSESMGRVSRDARLTFLQMWTLADDAGRLRGNSRMLASLLFPYDDDAPSLIEGWMSELEREGCIERYQADGQSYIQICNWLIHQKIDKPSASKIPELSKPREDSRTFVVGREGKGEEWKGRERSTASQSDAPSMPQPTEGALTPAAVCIALRETGIGKVNPAHADLAPLLQAGATLEDFLAAGNDAKGKTNPFAYAIATVKGRLSQPVSNGHQHRESFAERRDRERMETLHALTGGRAGQAPTPEKEAVHGTAIRVD